MRLASVALGVALCDVDHRIREEGGNNRGPRVRRYLANVEPPITVHAPWCAAAIQLWADVAAKGLGVPNPLDEVRHEALVQSYFDHFAPHALVPFEAVAAGDLALFKFPNGPDRWNHIGIVAREPDDDGVFWCVEGNTSDSDQRDGDGVYLKPRLSNADYPVVFIRWHVAGTWGE